MEQSTVIFLSLFLAFIVFITMRGELAKYIALFIEPATPNPQATTGTGQSTQQHAGSGGGSNVISTVASVAPALFAFL